MRTKVYQESEYDKTSENTEALKGLVRYVLKFYKKENLFRNINKEYNSINELILDILNQPKLLDLILDSDFLNRSSEFFSLSKFTILEAYSISILDKISINKVFAYKFLLPIFGYKHAKRIWEFIDKENISYHQDLKFIKKELCESLWRQFITIIFAHDHVEAFKKFIDQGHYPKEDAKHNIYPYTNTSPNCSHYLELYEAGQKRKRSEVYFDDQNMFTTKIMKNNENLHPNSFVLPIDYKTYYSSKDNESITR